jgi:LysR family glycine cleavage system transcriptional activator
LPANLPPLNAVKAFEASARLGSFSRAARELGVTAGAISQQVRILEDFFEKQLFLRRNNQLQLTDAGLAVYADSAQVIERLSEMTRRLRTGQTRSRFVVSALPSVAVRWLNGKLAAFLATRPALRCELRVEEDPVDFARHHIDLRICYGRHLYPEMVVRPLLRDVVTPLCTPDYLARRGRPLDAPGAIEDSELIHVDWGGSFASHPTWAEWFAAAGAPRMPEVALGHTAGMSSLALDLALAGCGIALGQRMLAAEDIAAGRLLAPFGESLALGHDYCAVHPQSRLGHEVLQGFLAWLSPSL